MMNENRVPECCPLDEELEPVYYAKCGYCWPEFIDMGAFVTSKVHFCPYQKELNCHTEEEAERIVAEMNQKEECLVCGSHGKFKSTTNFDMYNEKRILDQIVNSDGQSR